MTRRTTERKSNTAEEARSKCLGMSDSEEPNKSRMPEKSITVNYSYDDILKNPELLNLDQIFS